MNLSKDWHEKFQNKLEELKENSGLSYEEIYKIIKIYATPLENLKKDCTCDVVRIGVDSWEVKGRVTPIAHICYHNELQAYRAAKIRTTI